MINIKELRIGNKLHLLGEEIEVDGIFNLPGRKDMYWIRPLNGLECKMFHFKPIPLTEEKLEEFGFVIRDKTWSLNYGGESMRYALLEKYKDNHTFILYFHKRHGKILYNTEEGFRVGDHAIEFVHQLQNLFFYLTGEEL